MTMTDEELVAVLRWRGSALQEGAFPAAADRIEALTAEYEEAMECNEQFFVDNEFLKKQVTALTAERAALAMSCLSADGEAQRAWDAQKTAEAERDRLRRGIEHVLDGYGLSGPDYRFPYGEEESDWITDHLIAVMKGESHE